jgi:hypothetical protein
MNEIFINEIKPREELVKIIGFDLYKFKVEVDEKIKILEKMKVS